MSDPVERMLVDAFTRHEELVPAAADLRQGITEGAHRRRRRRRWAMSGAAAVLALVVTLPVVVLAQRHQTATAQSGAATETAAPPGRPLDFLLLGTDRSSQSAGDTVRADAILVLHLDPATHTAYQITVPRDVGVAVDGFGRQPVGNSYVFGGYEQTARSVGKLLGLTFDGGVVVDFNGLQQVTDAAGGVDLCVDQRTESIHLGYDKSPSHVVPLREGLTPVVYEPGCRHFSGWQALDYLRQRQNLAHGAEDREAHVRQFLASLTGRLGDPVTLARVMPVASKYLDVHLDGLPLATLRALSSTFDKQHMPGIRLPVQPSKDGAPLTTLPDSDGLVTALHDGTLPAWLTAHPQYAA